MPNDTMKAYSELKSAVEAFHRRAISQKRQCESFLNRFREKCVEIGMKATDIYFLTPSTPYSTTPESLMPWKALIREQGAWKVRIGITIHTSSGILGSSAPVCFEFKGEDFHVRVIDEGERPRTEPYKTHRFIASDPTSRDIAIECILVDLLHVGVEMLRELETGNDLFPSSRHPSRAATALYEKETSPNY